MSTWAKNSDLFLYTKGDDVYLWKCNNTTWMPMITADFDDLGKVMDHLDLIGGRDSLLDWDKSSYNDLIAYISPRRLLVNSQGLVIAELHIFSQDGKMDENELPFYIRSLDVLSLKPFNLRNRTIPFRTVRYLEAEGRAAPEEDSMTTSIESDDEKWASLKKQVAELITVNKTLKSDKEAAEKQVTELQDAIKRDKEAAEKQVAELKETNKTLKEAADKQVTELKETNKSLKSEKEAAEKHVQDLQVEIGTRLKEVWMNDVTTNSNNWVDISWFLQPDRPARHSISVVGPLGTFMTEDNTTNVRASYFRKLNFTTTTSNFVAVAIDDLTNKEKATFDKSKWWSNNHDGRTYVLKSC